MKDYLQVKVEMTPVDFMSHWHLRQWPKKGRRVTPPCLIIISFTLNMKTMRIKGHDFPFNLMAHNAK